MENILNRPKAILFARVDNKDQRMYLDNRMWMVRRYAREHDYYTIYGTFSAIHVKEVEKQFLPFLTEVLFPDLEEEIGPVRPYPVTIIVCFWHELVSNKRRPKFKKKLEELGITVKEIGNK